MPSIVYVHPPKSPTRKMPKNVSMTTVEPSPWACLKCKRRATTYADGTVWCERCGHKLTEHHKVDVSRGRQRNMVSPEFVMIKG